MVLSATGVFNPAALAPTALSASLARRLSLCIQGLASPVGTITASHALRPLLELIVPHAQADIMLIAMQFANNAQISDVKPVIKLNALLASLNITSSVAPATLAQMVALLAAPTLPVPPAPLNFISIIIVAMLVAYYHNARHVKLQKFALIVSMDTSFQGLSVRLALIVA